jgi:hypothetical protein
MEGGDKGLEKKVNKILWTNKFNNLTEEDNFRKPVSDFRKQIFERCQELEKEGYGILEDVNNPGYIDSNRSVVCPDGSIFTEEQINDYLMERRGGFNSENPEDKKRYNMNMYYTGFKEFHLKP